MTCAILQWLEPSCEKCRIHLVLVAILMQMSMRGCRMGSASRFLDARAERLVARGHRLWVEPLGVDKALCLLFRYLAHPCAPLQPVYDSRPRWHHTRTTTAPTTTTTTTTTQPPPPPPPRLKRRATHAPAALHLQAQPSFCVMGNPCTTLQCCTYSPATQLTPRHPIRQS